MNVHRYLPSGYVVEETDEKISTLAVRYFRWRAERYPREFPALIPTYHLRVERVGLIKYEINAYQNRAVPR